MPKHPDAWLRGKETGRPMTTGNPSTPRPSAGLWGPTSYFSPHTSPGGSSIGYNLGDTGLTIQKPRHFRNLAGELAGRQDMAVSQSQGSFCKWCNFTLWSSGKPPAWLPQSGRMLMPCAIVTLSELPGGISGSKKCCLVLALAFLSAYPHDMRCSRMALMLCRGEDSWFSSLSVPIYL